MSAYHNQTNISPGTLFSGSGGGSNFPTGIDINNNGVNNNLLRINTLAYWGQPILQISPDLSGTSLPLAANPFFAYSYDGQNATSQKSGSYASESIKYQGSNGAGNQTIFLEVNDTSLGTGSSFALNGISTINTTSTVVWNCGGGFNNLLIGGTNGGVRFLPNQNQINAQNLVFTSTISPISAGGTGTEGTINMIELTSSIKGYGWATVLPGVP